MRLVAIVGAVVVALGLTGCGSQPDRTHLARVELAAHTESGPTAAGNKAKAVAEAKRLLGLATVPAGAQLRHPAKGGGPAEGTPTTTSLIDKFKEWYIDEPLGRVMKFVRAEHPEGLTMSGSSSGDDGGRVTSEGESWSEPDRSYAIQPQLEIGVTSHGKGSLIRADGVDEWLDPRPIRDQTTGPRLRLTVAAGCPSYDGKAQTVSNTGKALRTELLPSQAPTAAIICIFGGANSKGYDTLSESAKLGPKAAAKLAGRFLKVPLSHTNGDVTSCPADFGGVAAIAFSYPKRSDVDEWMTTSGCTTTRNGFIVADGSVSLKPWITQPVDTR